MDSAFGLAFDLASSAAACLGGPPSFAQIAGVYAVLPYCSQLDCRVVVVVPVGASHTPFAHLAAGFGDSVSVELVEQDIVHWHWDQNLAVWGMAVRSSWVTSVARGDFARGMRFASFGEAFDRVGNVDFALWGREYGKSLAGNRIGLVAMAFGSVIESRRSSLVSGGPKTLGMSARRSSGHSQWR